MSVKDRRRFNKYNQFDGTNFNNWKFRMEVLLEEKNVQEFIERPLVDLLDDAEDSVDEEEIKQREKKCKSILVRCVHDSQLEHIKDKKKAKEMFDALKAAFQRKSVVDQLPLRKRLLTMKYVDGEDMAKHLLKFDVCVRELKSIGANMENIDVICHLVLTLPKSYDNLVTVIETIDPLNLSIDFVKSQLLNEFQKRTFGAATKRSADSVAMNV